MSSWADLRQVVFASTDPVGDGRLFRDRLGLGAGFGDPELAEHGLTDDTMAVGPATFLEIVSPTTADHPLAGWLAKRSGAGGYLLSIQVSDIDACLRRCAEHGARVTLTHIVQGHTIAQLHPSDMGMAVELDGISQRGVWFWDGLDVDRPERARIDDVIAVDVATADPERVMALWASIFDIGDDDADQANRALAFGHRRINFTAAGGGRRGLAAVHVHATDRADAGSDMELCNVAIRLV